MRTACRHPSGRATNSDILREQEHSPRPRKLSGRRVTFSQIQRNLSEGQVRGEPPREPRLISGMQPAFALFEDIDYLTRFFCLLQPMTQLFISKNPHKRANQT